jgi:hypothetical protein
MAWRIRHGEISVQDSGVSGYFPAKNFVTIVFTSHA